jgi:altronate hydrolase
MELELSVVDQVADAAVIRLHPRDNVVVASSRLSRNALAIGEGIRALEPIPSGHKMATRRIASGQSILKYGQVIGTATQDIEAGSLVHLHNLAVTALRAEAEPAHLQSRVWVPRSFQGYLRSDGRVGVRNYVGILTSVNCSATVARLIAQQAERSGLLDQFPHVDGVVPITHTSGCGMAGSGEGYDLLRRTLWGTAANPNFGAILLVGLGCEVIQIGRFAKDFGLAGRDEFQSFTIQDSGGTRKSVEHGLARLKELLPIADAARRSKQPASQLVLGLQCGGSDAWSGVSSNPALGAATDQLVALGGTALLSETPEIYGAEHLLYARATEPSVAAKLRARLDWWEHYTSIHGAEMNNNPSPGNQAGGLSTILEKSLGAVAKGGTSTLTDVIEYAEQLKTRGLVFMDSPGFDPCSATGQVASGANIIAFTTGRGSAFGFKPSPSIKLSSNSDVFRRMRDDIDFDCGPIVSGEMTVAEAGEAIFDTLLNVASGTRSKSEELGYGGSEFVPWLIGATM